MNIERIYRTTVPADALARALADHFRAQDFEAQVFHSTENRTVVQARQESLWRQVLGVAYAMTVILLTRGGHAGSLVTRAWAWSFRVPIPYGLRLRALRPATASLSARSR